MQLTEVRLLEKIDITNEYKHSFTFQNALTQRNFFMSKTKHIFENLKYQRKERSIIVEKNIDRDLYNVNYLMFQNAEFSDKWWYAFITDMKFKNENTTEITFEIDVLQTWKFDVKYTQSYIDREHVADDTIGKHLLNENLDVGEYVNNTSVIDSVDALDDLSILVASTVERDGSGGFKDVDGDVYGGVYSGIAYLYFPNTDPGITALNGFLKDITADAKSDAIVTMFVIPKALLPTGVSVGNPIPTSEPWESVKTVFKNTTNLDDYIPKNNKLFVYPYNMLYVSNNQGASAVYRYENFSGNSECKFTLDGDLGPSPTVIMSPQDYKTTSLNYDETFKLSGYPLLSWTTDIFKEWLSKNAVSAPLSIASSALSLGVGVATFNPVAVGAGVLGVAGSIGRFHEKSIQPNHTKGSVSGNVNVAVGIQNFFFYNKVIKYERAKVIDDYFTKYGYKVNELKFPNFETRPYFNYIKCHEANIFGDIPNTDLKKYNEIFERGITFWHSDNVGNYNLNNSN